MNVLVAGAGIGGLTLAYWLHRAGVNVTVVERAPRLRTGGYMIDFFGSGYDVAERMAILPLLEGIHYPIPRFSFLRPDGSVQFSIPYARFRALLGDRHFNFLRGDLEQVLYDLVRDDVPFRFGASVRHVRERAGRVEVTLEGGDAVTADLLVGADGLHSTTRAEVFGDGPRFERFVGYHCAAFVLDDPPDLGIRSDTFYTLTEPRRQLTLYPLRGGKLATFFIQRAEKTADAATRRDPRPRLREVYADMGWAAPRLLEMLERVPDIYYDDVSQVVMPRWSAGRVVLVGDACQCVSLLAGQGASMAMAGAYVLAEELAGAPADVPAALSRYEVRMRPHIERKQEAGRRMGRWFVPESRLGIALRDVLTRAATLPVVSSLARRWVAGDSMFEDSRRPR